MAKKQCVECENNLTFWNQSMKKDLCMQCYRDIFISGIIAFFERTNLNEQDIINHPLFAEIWKYLMVSAIIIAGWFVGAEMMGFVIGGPFGFAFMSILVNKPMFQSIKHPLDKIRFNNYFLAQMVSFMIIYFSLYIFTILQLAYQIVIPKIFLYIVPPILSVGLGVLFIYLMDKKTKAQLLEKFQRWKQKNLMKE